MTDGFSFTVLSLPFIDWGVFSSHIVSRAWYTTLYIRTKLLFGTTSDQNFFKKIMLSIVVLTSVCLKRREPLENGPHHTYLLVKNENDDTLLHVQYIFI